MSNETIVTVHGWLGSDPQTYQAGTSTVTKFRVACTPRRFNPASGEWYDAETQWFSVSAWRQLGQHCATSLRRGHPVIVHGRLSMRTYTDKQGAMASSLDIDAVSVGPDLGKGIASFSRSVTTLKEAPERSQAPRSAEEEPPAEADREEGREEGRPSDWSAA